MEDKELQVAEKKELQTPAENIRNVPTFVPPVDISEMDNELVILADMPGIPMENVEIDLNGDQLTIRGRVPHANGDGTNGRVLWSEYREGDYYRQFTLSRAIDREKIEAIMKDGVLKVVLPKADILKPRKIEVKAS